MLFNIVCFAGSLLNPDHVHPLPAISQLLMWNEPIILFLAIISLPFSLADIDKFRRLLYLLFYIEVIIGLFQVPLFIRSGDSESIIGTFSGNAEQYQFFVLIGFFSILAELHVTRLGNAKRIAAIFSILLLVVLIENKASWVALGLTLVIFIPKLPKMGGRLPGLLKSNVLLAVLLFVGYKAITLTSATYTTKFSRLAEAFETGNVMNLGKVKALRDVATAYNDHLHMPIVGAGLGTFYSRAAFQFFPFHIADLYDSAPAAGGVAGDSASMAGVIKPIEGIRPFYKTFYKYDRIFATGSGTADFPTSSYISLLGETGLLGTVAYLWFYYFALRQARSTMRLTAGNSPFFPFAAATYAAIIYLLFMGCYNHWLDCGRVNTIVWSMLALSVRYGALQQQRLDRGLDYLLPQAPVSSAASPTLSHA